MSSLDSTLLLIVSLFNLVNSQITNFADVACGKRWINARIVGGSDASPGEFPWIVSITKGGGHFCGGTLLNNRWVLTAAHCLCNGGHNVLEPEELKVTVGGHDLRVPTGTIVPVSRVHLHPSYICSRYVDDIALVELSYPLVWSDAVRPACFPSQSTDSFTNSGAVVAGWGWTSESTSGGRAKVLQKVSLTVLGNEKCRDWYRSLGKKVKILDSQMCAGFEEGGKDSCWADSGGPLMITGVDGTMVVGIVSTGIGCARPKLPGLYTRISDYVNWIGQTLKR